MNGWLCKIPDSERERDLGISTTRFRVTVLNAANSTTMGKREKGQQP